MVKIPVAMMFNDNYAIPSAPAIFSLLFNADKQHFYELYILHSDITSEHQEKIKQIVEEFPNASLKFINMNKKFYEYKEKLFFPPEFLYKLCLASLFPNIDKMIVTDVDVVFMDDISKEFVDFNTKEYFAGAKQTQYIKHKPFSQNIQDDNAHFITGAGYMIYNLAQMRQDQMEEKYLDYLKKNIKYLKDAEQEVLNQVSYPHIKLLHPKNMVLCSWYMDYQYVFEYTYTSSRQEFEEAKASPVQLHYVTAKYKPWINPFAPKADVWYYYLSQTPFFTEHFSYHYNMNEKFLKKNKKRLKQKNKQNILKQFFVKLFYGIKK